MPTRLYKVGEVFYYRRKYKGKLFRISLRTQTFRVALYRKRLLDLLKGEELFQIKHSLDKEFNKELENLKEQSKELDNDMLLDKAIEEVYGLDNQKDMSNSLSL